MHRFTRLTNYRLLLAASVGLMLGGTGCNNSAILNALGAYGETLKVLTVPAEAIVSIQMSAEEGDPYLELLDEDRQIIKVDDDSGPGRDAMLKGFLKAGTYYVRARNISSSSGSFYALQVSGASLSDPTTDVREAIRTSSLYYDSEDMWSVSLLQASRVQIRAMGHDDPIVVQVLDDRFQEVIPATRDDLVILSDTLEAGAYTVRISARGTDSGRYTLSVFAADVPQIDMATTPSQRDRD